MIISMPNAWQRGNCFGKPFDKRARLELGWWPGMGLSGGAMAHLPASPIASHQNPNRYLVREVIWFLCCINYTIWNWKWQISLHVMSLIFFVVQKHVKRQTCKPVELNIENPAISKVDQYPIMIFFDKMFINQSIWRSKITESDHRCQPVSCPIRWALYCHMDFCCDHLWSTVQIICDHLWWSSAQTWAQTTE